MNRVKMAGLGIVMAVVLAACSYGASPNGTSPTPAPAGGTQPTVMVASNQTLGSILVDAKGMTLYVFTKDTANTSNCSGGCATAWPPLTVPAGVTPTAGSGVQGTLGTIQRSDGSYQVTINGMPLYYFAQDTKAGDTDGQGVQSVWYVVGATGAAEIPAAPASSGQYTVMVADNPTLGKVLVDGQGMTLYVYTKDTANTSNCIGGCATAWPPLAVADGVTPTAGPGVVGTLGVIRREDGTSQVTISGEPLYYFAQDAKPGEVTGQGVQSVWYVVQESGSAVVPPPASGGQATVMVATNATLGQILVDAKGMTLYTYAKDTVNASNCSGACATNWPPLTVAAGVTPTAGPGVQGSLGVIQRADGTYQVTIDGMPLYYFAKDTKPGDANGQGVASVWYVVQEVASQ